MEGHLSLLVDRLLTESSLAAARPPQTLRPNHNPQNRIIDEDIQIKSLILGECRICHDDDLEFNLEVPCSCCGSLKYAHRKCVQRWCDEKGDTLCEICLQPFKPDYTAPPKLLHYGSMPMAFRGNWGISRQNSNGPRLIPDDEFADDDYDDQHASNARSVAFCRSVALLLSVLVVLSHTLPIFMSFGDEWWYSVAEVLFLVMRAMGILLPIIIMTRALLVFQRRHRQRIWE